MPRIYVASLSDYNAGTLHGQWLDALDGYDACSDAINTILSTSPEAAKTGLPAEGWAIHYTEDFGDINIGEHEDLETVCALAEAIEEHGEPFAVLWDYETFSSVAEALEIFQDTYRGTFASLEDWAEDYAESTGMLDSIPQNLRYYFDFERFARDCEINGDINCFNVSDGVAVFNHY